jgi:hypothetical protein
MKLIGFAAILFAAFNSVEAFAQESLTSIFRFEANQGQAAPAVKYVAVGSAYKAELEDNQVVLPIDRTRLTMTFKGGMARGIEPLNDLNLLTNYYRGQEPAHTGIRNYGRVVYKDVYPGIDVVFYGSDGKLEFDFIVSQGANTNSIDLEFSGHKSLVRAGDGNLILNTSDGDLIVSAPRVYQEEESGRRVIDGSFVRKSTNEIAFAAGTYDRSRSLVIDPALAWSGYTSIRSQEWVTAIRYDDAGNIYATFRAERSCCDNFPRVEKISRDGTPSYITELGPEWTAFFVDDIAVDSQRNVYGVGGIQPLLEGTPGPLHTKNAIHPLAIGAGGLGDGYVFKLSPTGEVIFATYLGSPDHDEAYSIAIDPLQTTISILLATGQFGTPGTTYVTKMSADGQSIISSTSVAGRFKKLQLDASGNTYLCCRIVSGPNGDSRNDVVKLNAGGSVLWRWSGPVADMGLDRDGNVYTLRVEANSGDEFIDKLDANGHLIASSGALHSINVIAVDSAGNVYFTGSGNPDLPVINSFRPQPSGFADLPIQKMSSDLKHILYSTFINGTTFENLIGPAPGGISTGFAISVNDKGAVFVGGRTNTIDFPATTNAGKFPGADTEFFVPIALVLDPNVPDASPRYTRLEEDYFAIHYSGNWYPNTSPYNSAGRAVLAVEAGAKASLSFTGSGKVSWFGCRDGWSGIAKVWVDGAVQATVDTYSYNTTCNTEIWSTALPPGAHTIAIEVSGNKNPEAHAPWVWVDKFEIVSAGDIAFGTASSSGGSGGGTGGTGGDTGGGSTTFTRVEQNNSAVGYTGTWYANNGAFNSGGSALLAGGQGARATFTFSGTAAKWIGFKDAYSGIANVYVDGVPKGQVDAYSASDQSKVVMYTVSGLASGTHTLNIEVSGTKNSASNSYWIWVDAFEYAGGTITAGGGTDGSGGDTGGGAATFTRFEQNNSAVGYTGTWYTNNGMFNSGGSAVLAGGKGARATFAFSGTSAKWIGFKDAYSGIANVYVDGTLQGQVDAYSASDQAKVVMYTITGLTSGTHTLAIEVSGNKNTSSNSYWIWIDAFEAAAAPGGGGTGGGSGGTTNPGTYTRVEQNNAAIVYTSNWYGNTGTFNSGGSAALSATLGARATFTFSGTSVKWIGYRDAWSGIANVYIDGVMKTQVDTYASADQAQAVNYTITGLTPGTHTITIEATGTKNASAKAAWAWVDAFEYSN